MGWGGGLGGAGGGIRMSLACANMDAAGCTGCVHLDTCSLPWDVGSCAFRDMFDATVISDGAACYPGLSK